MSRAARKMPGRVRLIAGRWKGRKLTVPEAPGLRPSPDRVRETLFNWLAPEIPGSRCLDVFAGTGALALEALSRGAEEVVLLERDATVHAAIEDTLVALEVGDGAQVYRCDAIAWLRTAVTRPFDVVFLDPPFGGTLLEQSLQALAERPVLSAGAWIYVETDRPVRDEVLPGAWQLHRARTAGKVRYHLYRTL